MVSGLSKIQKGDIVLFTGYGYRRAKMYRYDELFGHDEYIVKGIRETCCKRFLLLEIDGTIMPFDEKYFLKVE